MYLRDGEIVAQSRTGNHFKSMERITSSLRPFFQQHPAVVLDGELYTKDIPFEVLAGIIKKQKITADDSVILETITYNVYDIVDSSGKNLGRAAIQTLSISQALQLKKSTGQPLRVLAEWNEDFESYIVTTVI